MGVHGVQDVVALGAPLGSVHSTGSQLLFLHRVEASR